MCFGSEAADSVTRFNRRKERVNTMINHLQYKSMSASSELASVVYNLQQNDI